MIFPVIFAALYASHFTLLGVPYYWDEAGYYIPAAWDFFRTGSLIPITTLTNAHPPLPSIYLALWWKASGFFPEVTREAVLMVAALGLLAVWRLAMRLVGVAAVAFWTVVLTGLYPIWFAQSSLAHADIFAAACTLWGLVYALPERDRKPWAAALWFSAAALSKETAIVDSADAGSGEPGRGFRAPRLAGAVASVAEAAWLSSCVLPLAAWYAWHYAKTGFLFGNPEFLRYNAQANLSPLRFLAAFGHRILHLTAHMNMFVPVLMTIAALLLEPRPDARGGERAGIGRCALRRIVLLLLVNAVLFSVLGGALLTRYLLPMYPLVLLVAVTTFYRRIPYWQGLPSSLPRRFLWGCLSIRRTGLPRKTTWPTPTSCACTWQESPARTPLSWRYGALRVAHDRRADTARAWLRKAALGCGEDRGLHPAQIAIAAQEPEKYSAALVFSTKYDPPSSLLSLGARSEALDERFFGLHHDLPPEMIAERIWVGPWYGSAMTMACGLR